MFTAFSNKQIQISREECAIQTKIAILDQEIGPGLCRYLLGHPSCLQPVLCSDWEELEDVKAPIALIGGNYWQDEARKNASTQHMFLIPLIEKVLSPYQPADQLLRQIYALALEKDIYLPGSLCELSEREVVAVCSPHGYDFQTGFCLVYGSLQAQTKRTLYINFQYYSGYLTSENSMHLGALLYEIGTGKKTLGKCLPKYVNRFGNLEYIAPVNEPMDLEDLEGKDFMRLVQRLLQECDYELIVLDLPVSPKFIRAAYACCSRMYSLQREGILFHQSQTRLLEDLNLEKDATDGVKFQIVCMPKISGSIRLDATMYEELLFGEMADFIRNNIS